MTDIEPKKKRAPGAGRPAYPTEQVARNVSIRLTESQRDMLKVLGGVNWIREKLDHELNKLNHDN